MTMLEVLRTGPLTTVQDLGRAGHAHLGVPRSGAADVAAHRRANAAVGNGDDAATLETTLLGCTLRARGDLVLAVDGAPCDVFVGGVRAPWGAPFRVRAGQVVDVGAATRGLRSYVAVRGGIDVPPVLGSRSTDTLSGLGPGQVRVGDLLPVGEADLEGAATAFAAPLFAGRESRGVSGPEHGVRHPDAGTDTGTDTGAAAASPRIVAVVRGPRADWLSEEGWAALTSTDWRVSASSNRVGVRFDGPPLVRARDGEIPSEGLVTGAVQLPPSGLPVAFLADHPTTGGYPVIAVATGDGIAALAQARPGESVRFSVGVTARLAAAPAR